MAWESFLAGDLSFASLMAKAERTVGRDEAKRWAEPGHGGHCKYVGLCFHGKWNTNEFIA